MVSFTYEEFTLFIESIAGFKSKRQMVTQFNKIQRLVENKKNFTSKDIMKIFKLSTLKKPKNAWHLFIESVSKDFEPGLDGKGINRQCSPLWQKLFALSHKSPAANFIQLISPAIKSSFHILRKVLINFASMDRQM